MQLLTSNGFAADDNTPALMIHPVKAAAKVLVGKVEVTPSDVVIGHVRIPVHVQLLAADSSDTDFITTGTLSSRKVPGRQDEFLPILQPANLRDKKDQARLLAYLAPMAPCGCNLSFSTPEGKVVAWTTVQEPKDPTRRNQKLGVRDEILIVIDPGEVVVAHIQPVRGREDEVENFYLCNDDGVSTGWLTQEQYDARTAEVLAPAPHVIEVPGQLDVTTVAGIPQLAAAERRDAQDDVAGLLVQGTAVVTTALVQAAAEGTICS